MVNSEKSPALTLALPSGDQSAVEPPGPIPNPEVKRRSADGSETIGLVRVGRRQVYARLQAIGAGLFAFGGGRCRVPGLCAESERACLAWPQTPNPGVQGFSFGKKMNLVIRVARTTDYTDFTERISTMITDGATTCQVSEPGDATYSQSVQSVISVVFIFLSRLTHRRSQLLQRLSAPLRFVQSRPQCLAQEV